MLAPTATTAGRETAPAPPRERAAPPTSAPRFPLPPPFLPSFRAHKPRRKLTPGPAGEGDCASASKGKSRAADVGPQVPAPSPVKFLPSFRAHEPRRKLTPGLAGEGDCASASKGKSRGADVGPQVPAPSPVPPIPRSSRTHQPCSKLRLPAQGPAG